MKLLQALLVVVPSDRRQRNPLRTVARSLSSWSFVLNKEESKISAIVLPSVDNEGLLYRKALPTESGSTHINLKFQWVSGFQLRHFLEVPISYRSAALRSMSRSPSFGVLPLTVVRHGAER